MAPSPRARSSSISGSVWYLIIGVARAGGWRGATRGRGGDNAVRVQKAILLHASLAPGLLHGGSEPLLQALPYARRLQIERRDAATRAASLAGLALALTAAGAHCDAARARRGLQLHGRRETAVRARPGVQRVAHGDRVACVVVRRRRRRASTSRRCRRPPAMRRCASCCGGRRPKRRSRPRAWACDASRDVSSTAPALAADLDGRRYVLREVRLTPRHDRARCEPRSRSSCGIDAVALDGAEVSAAVQRALGLPAQG